MILRRILRRSATRTAGRQNPNALIDYPSCERDGRPHARGSAPRLSDKISQLFIVHPVEPLVLKACLPKVLYGNSHAARHKVRLNPEADKGFIHHRLRRYNALADTPLICGAIVHFNETLKT